METAMNTHARTHNNPPDPLDEALAPYGDFIAEAEGWLDGEPVQTEDQMKAVDAILKQIKAAEKAVKDAEESEAKPIYDAWKAAKARFAPTLDDLGRIKKGLVSIVDVFKRKLAAEKAEAERKARAEAEAKRREAEKAARKADAADIEAQREAAEAMEAAKQAQAEAAAASKDTVKGLRTVTKYEVTDHRALLHWIAKNDRDAITAFVDEYARRNHRDIVGAEGLNVWQEKVAF
jgi:chromosome segregation ATPase